MSELRAAIDRELALAQAESLGTFPLVVFKDVFHIFEELYLFLSQRIADIICHEDNTAELLFENNTTLKLKLSSDSIAALNELLQNGKTQIGILGGHPVFFDLHAKERVSIGYERHILGDPLQLNAHIHPEYLEVLRTVESWGEITAVQMTNETITLDFASGGKRVITNEDEHFSVYTTIFSQEMHEVGYLLTGDMYYHPQIGFYSAVSGRVLTAAELESVNFDAEAFRAIQRYLSKKPQHAASHYASALIAGEAIYAGKCAGRDKVYIFGAAGLVQKSEKNHSLQTREYDRLCETARSKKLLSILRPGAHFHMIEKKGMRQVLCIGTDGRPDFIPETHKYFAWLEALTDRKRGFVKFYEDGEEVLLTLTYTEGGLLYASQKFDEEKFLQLRSDPDAVEFLVFTPQGTQKKFSRTRREKRLREQKKMPRKRA